MKNQQTKITSLWRVFGWFPLLRHFFSSFSSTASFQKSHILALSTSILANEFPLVSTLHHQQTLQQPEATLTSLSPSFNSLHLAHCVSSIQCITPFSLSSCAITQFLQWVAKKSIALHPHFYLFK